VSIDTDFVCVTLSGRIKVDRYVCQTFEMFYLQTIDNFTFMHYHKMQNKDTEVLIRQLLV